jgi:solute carrier family 45 protein 1/2/4
MTGFSALSMADEAAEEGSAAQWAGVAKVLGPRWARLSVLTVGFAGVQVMWSIEMAYGEQNHRENDTRSRSLRRLMRMLCSFAIPYLPWHPQISNGPRLPCWSSLRPNRPAHHRSAQPSLPFPTPKPIADCCAGVMSDNSKSRFGRRRPYIAAGVALSSMGLILLGFTRNFASIITTWGSPAVSITSFILTLSAHERFRTTF